MVSMKITKEMMYCKQKDKFMKTGDYPREEIKINKKINILLSSSN